MGGAEHLKFAVYVICLVQILRDVRSFLIVLVIVMAAFAHVFTMVMTTPELGLVPDAFDDYEHTFFSLYCMILGDFNRAWFQDLGIGGPKGKAAKARGLLGFDYIV